MHCAESHDVNKTFNTANPGSFEEVADFLVNQKSNQNRSVNFSGNTISIHNGVGSKHCAESHDTNKTINIANPGSLG